MRVLSWSVVIALLGTPVAVLVFNPDPIAPQVHTQPPAGALDPGVVSGVVVGADGAVVKGVRVELMLHDREVMTVTTDAQGRFRFAKVPPGLYSVVALSEGLAPAVMLVAVNSLPGIPLRLALGIPSEAREEATASAAPAPLAADGLAKGTAQAVVQPASPSTSDLERRASRLGVGSMPAPQFSTASY